MQHYCWLLADDLVEEARALSRRLVRLCRSLCDFVRLIVKDFPVCYLAEEEFLIMMVQHELRLKSEVQDWFVYASKHAFYFPSCRPKDS